METLCAGPLVRAISSVQVAIWTEWSCVCDVTLAITPAVTTSQPSSEDVVCRVSTRTVCVGGRYYALSLATGLQAATWYNYRIYFEGERTNDALPEDGLLHCFRTLDASDADVPLRLAYGSCRKLSSSEGDALSAFGNWLVDCQEERESRWPRFLLLIGDQIYADEDMPDGPLRISSAAVHSVIPSFEDFASLYVRAWTRDEGIRQLLAVMPTYMIFDDHEIINDWNSSPGWRGAMLRQGCERLLVDGLVAYWVYQGWGNLALRDGEKDDLGTIMQQGLQSGEDVLEYLRLRVRRSVLEEETLRWDYTLPTKTPIFVADVRADRPASLQGNRYVEDHPRIMSYAQMERLQDWMQAHDTETSLLISSVPVLLPPVIGLAQYLLGKRPVREMSRLRRSMADKQQQLALRLSFEHWPVFGATWREFVNLLRRRRHNLVVLSGDVHFSYAMESHLARLWRFGEKRAHCYQLVASPFKNQLLPKQRRLILRQSWFQRIFYSGLWLRILPLKRSSSEVQAQANLLLQGTVALVTIWPQKANETHETLRQVYLGLTRQGLQEVGHTTF